MAHDRVCAVCGRQESDAGTLKMSGTGLVCPRGSCQARAGTTDQHALVCKCGHTAHWHGQGGAGACENGSGVPAHDGEPCRCSWFDLDHTDTYESLRYRVKSLEALLATAREHIAAAARVPVDQVVLEPDDCG